MVLVLVLFGATIFLIFALGPKPGQAAFLSIFFSSLAWPVLRLRQQRLIYSGYTVAINVAAGWRLDLSWYAVRESPSTRVSIQTT
jgi:hypothetical protein